MCSSLALVHKASEHPLLLSSWDSSIQSGQVRVDRLSTAKVFFAPGVGVPTG